MIVIFIHQTKMKEKDEFQQFLKRDSLIYFVFKKR